MRAKRRALSDQQCDSGARFFSKYVFDPPRSSLEWPSKPLHGPCGRMVDCHRNSPNPQEAIEQSERQSVKGDAHTRPTVRSCCGGQVIDDDVGRSRECDQIWKRRTNRGDGGLESGPYYSERDDLDLRNINRVWVNGCGLASAKGRCFFVHDTLQLCGRACRRHRCLKPRCSRNEAPIARGSGCLKLPEPHCSQRRCNTAAMTASYLRVSWSRPPPARRSRLTSQAASTRSDGWLGRILVWLAAVFSEAQFCNDAICWSRKAQSCSVKAFDFLIN